jgi:hypothetical protein
MSVHAVFLHRDMYEGSWKGYHCCECGKKFECEKHDKLICDMDDFVVLGRFCTPCWDRMCADLPPQIGAGDGGWSYFST